ncbi:unnamed protein product, partial [marine sediment metagenome]
MPVSAPTIELPSILLFRPWTAIPNSPTEIVLL